MRSLAVLGLAATVSVALAACGGDDSGAAATTAVVTSATTTIATTTTSPEVTYVIQKGDSLSKIAKQFNLTVAQLITINNITDADHIEAGQVLIIVPAATPLPTTTRSTRGAAVDLTTSRARPAFPGFGRPNPRVRSQHDVHPP